MEENSQAETVDLLLLQGVREQTEKNPAVNRWTCSKRTLSGRLLSEFLVALGLLFLALTANLAILHSASRASGDAARVNRALKLARDGLESLIAQPGSLAAERRFGADTALDDQTTFLRKTRLVPLSGELAGLTRAIVEVEWNNGARTQRVRLERYVRTT